MGLSAGGMMGGGLLRGHGVVFQLRDPVLVKVDFHWGWRHYFYKSHLKQCIKLFQAGQWGFIKYRPPKKTQNIDQISTTQHFIDQLSTAKVPQKARSYTFRDKSANVN